MAEEAWRELCGHASEGRIRAGILTGSGVFLEAGRAQFITLQERYIFNSGTQTYWLENEHQCCELELDPENEFFDKHGRSVRGQLLFSESDIEAGPMRQRPRRSLRLMRFASLTESRSRDRA